MGLTQTNVLLLSAHSKSSRNKHKLGHWLRFALIHPFTPNPQVNFTSVLLSGLIGPWEPPSQFWSLKTRTTVFGIAENTMEGKIKLNCVSKV